jgi:hypothetical protein
MTKEQRDNWSIPTPEQKKEYQEKIKESTAKI